MACKNTLATFQEKKRNCNPGRGAGRISIHGGKSEKFEPTNHDLPIIEGVSGRFKSDKVIYI